MAKKNLTDADLKSIHSTSIKTRIKKIFSSVKSSDRKVGDIPLPTKVGKRRRILRDKSKAASSDD